jgi:glucose/arabinose dehydrogenase
VIDEELLPEPFATPPAASRGEGGVLGLALHPSFPRKPFVYVYYTYSDNRGLLNRVSRFTAEGNRAVKEEIILDGIPGGAIHNGGRLSFGPEGYLYITTGDAGEVSHAQDLNSLGGKFLRVTDEGAIPKDNPFGSAVYSYGHRNPQGFDWAPNGNLIATEHGPRAHDEVNLILKGRNYGWPEVKGIASKEGFTDPLLESGLDTWAPSGAAFYRGSYFFAALRGRHLHKIVFNDDFTEVKNHEKLFEDIYGRLRHVAQGPGGELYLLTSNRDGRGSPAPADDRILKFVP